MNQSINIQERQRVSSLAHTCFSVQMEFDRKLIYLGYLTIKPYFTGSYGLELGCGDGTMTRYLLDDFASLTIVDGAAELVEALKPAPNLEKVHSLFEEFTPKRQFDTIIMCHILEHIESPVALLRQAKKWLTSGGRIVAIVPNALSFHRLAAVKVGWLRHPGQLNERDLAVGHRRVYRPDEFAADFSQAGLQVLQLGGLFFKPLSNQQIQDQWNDKMIEAFFELGKDFQKNAAEIYLVATNDI